MKLFIILSSFFISFNSFANGYVNVRANYIEINSNYALGAGLDAGFRLSKNLALEGYFDYLNFDKDDTMHFGFKVAYFFMKMLSLKAGAGIYNYIDSDSDSNFEILVSPGIILPISRTTFFTIQGVYKHLTNKDGDFLDHSYGASAGMMFIL